MNRRDFLKGCAAVAAATAFSGCVSAAEKDKKIITACAGKGKARARSVIEIWVWGGPCQLETFDPKPKASRDYNGGFKSIPTNVPGVIKALTRVLIVPK